MMCGVEVFGRMSIFRRIAASDVAADEAFAQVNPGVAHLQAFLTSPRALLNVLNLVQVCAMFRV